MALDAKGQAVFFTRRGKMVGSVPPPVREPRLTPALPPAPPLGPGQMYNGAARLANGAVPWAIEAAAREAVEEALEETLPEGKAPARAGESDTTPGSPPAFPRQNPGHEHVGMGQATEMGQATGTDQTQPEEVKHRARTRAA